MLKKGSDDCFVVIDAAKTLQNTFDKSYPFNDYIIYSLTIGLDFANIGIIKFYGILIFKDWKNGKAQI